MLREGSAAGAGPGKGYLHPPNYLDENACHACGGTRLTFEPAAIYCSICVQKIKRNQASTPCAAPFLAWQPRSRDLLSATPAALDPLLFPN